MPKTRLTHKRLLAALDYNQRTGVFKNKTHRGLRARKGETAGALHSKGYITIAIDYSRYFGHRLAWFYVNGSWPKGNLDHIDKNKTNNAIRNLRLATDSQNQHNRGKCKSNTTGYKGVNYIESSNKYRAKICKGRKMYHLGCFDTAKEAGAAYAASAKKLHGKFASL